MLGKRYLIDYQTRCIRIVNYISDGRILNSTIWHSSPFDPNNSNNLSYGILVDADSNKKTGYQGIDYKMELTWKNGSWYRILSELSSRGQQRILENSSFLDLHNTKKAYIDLSLDLNSINLPAEYDVSSYAQRKASYTLLDISSWIHLPPADFELYLRENAIILRPMEDTTIGVRQK